MVLATTSALYSSNSPVVQLTKENFNELVLKSNEYWLIEFYAPWCGHCKNLAPEYEKAAKALKGIVNIGAVDMTEHSSVGEPYRISGFPTLKFFGDNKKSPVDYDAGRTAKDIVSFVVKQADSIAQKRLSGKAETKKEEPKKKQEPKEEKPVETVEPEPEVVVDEADVIILTDKNFDATVLASDELFYVEFYAPWCTHCTTLRPIWAEAASTLKGKVKFGKVDSTVEKLITARYLINSFPSIKIFEPGNVTPIDYNGDRELSSFIESGTKRLEGLEPLPGLQQLLKNDDLSLCETNVCLISFLPHIYDSSSEERNKYISIFYSVSKLFRSRPLKFFWAQAGDFYKFEQFLGIGAGYPAVGVLSISKNRFGTMRSSFKSEEIEGFVQRLLSGSAALSEYKDLPKLSQAAAWDGKDHSPEVEAEEI
jgi:protein disulfide-isomerase A6